MRLGMGCVILCATLGFTSTAMGQKQTDLPFRLIDGWAVVVKGTIGGEPSRTILIDTGAVPSAISKEMAKKLGLLGSAEQVSVMNRAIGVERVRVPNVQVGPVAANSLDMVAADFGTIEQALHTRLDAVIGLDLLAAVTPTPHFMSTEPIVMFRAIIAPQATRVFKLRFCDSQAVSSGFLSLLARK